MPNENGLLLKAFSTVRTGERLLLHGDLLVFDQRGLLPVGFATVRAEIGLLPRM